MKNYDKEYGIFFKDFGPSLLKVVIIGGTVILLLAVLLFSFSRRYNKIDETHNTNISGVITNKFVYQGSSWIKVKNYPKRYVLKYAINYDLEPDHLSEFLQVGDSIYKPIHTDTLFIYKNGKKYLFILGNLTFNKK
mgnify:CR=1 FL=1